MNRRLVSLARYRVATDPLRTERKIELIAVLLALLLCMQLLYSGARFALATLPAAVAPAADALVARKIRPADSVSEAQSDAIQGRPLFWQGRRPGQTQGIAVKSRKSRGKGGELKDVKLLGVFGGGDTAGIIVSVKDKQRRILVGETLGEWTLASVQSNEVILAAGGKTKKLQLRTLEVVADTAPPVSGATSPAAPKPQAQPKKRSDSGEEQLSLGGGPRR